MKMGEQKTKLFFSDEFSIKPNV